MRKLMVVLVAVAFLAGASIVYADGHDEEDDDNEGKHAFVSEIQEVKNLLSEVLDELKRLNEAVVYNEFGETLRSLAEQQNEKLGGILRLLEEAQSPAE